ncbi:incFII family plasmid replication initiator RepA [Salmonella enterica]|uniref:plasmid replication initiator RepA n=1 Tax=Salmonella enterica TaxID=28901 RepID=UPI00071CF1C8|nr:plasmid replication initiator RepA [Salmonella enterica]EBM9478477.1 incFII family plasmid replication initiator RepA [Salmonella enterica subsp. enterica serovar Rubislaw]ECT6468412.1 incFII family plasmid replication initiator RepA [Salmonella enterica subsp. enterica serovar Senegal]EHC8528377.1 incFII family plasmid replication initiator RepA [Salmonella enterica subsp. enterica serovar 11:r:-]EAQ5803266.1 incFII family plasmid replication initiator RepA [Salmonella enterica]EBO3245171.
MTKVFRSTYIQVHNPFPVFTVPCKKGTQTPKRTLPFNKKLMSKAVGFTDTFAFSVLVAATRANGTRKRKPPVLRRRAIDALLQGLCFHYDPLANRVNATITTLASECGLLTESCNGTLSICRATRALHYLAEELRLITYRTEYDPEIGCYLPTDITFTPHLFEALEVSPEALESVRKSRAEYLNLQRLTQGKPRINPGEIITIAWQAFRKRFKEYRLMRKAYGEKRHKGRKEAQLTFREISERVRKELTQEIARGLFVSDLTILRREIKNRVKERRVLARGLSVRSQGQLAR